MLISVHIPKTAGSSFRAALASHFGDALSLDYADRPVNSSPLRRNLGALYQSRRTIPQPEPGCIHGHFLPLKYRWARTRQPRQFVMWLRDPVERLASHYYYWQRDYDPSTAGTLRRRMVEEDWCLEQFCFAKEMRNLYTSMLWGFPVGRFDFIGVTENYASDLSCFALNILQAELPQSEANVNPDRPVKQYVDDPALRRRIERFHSDDMQLYRFALAASNERKQV